jgi:hypothetical protein
MRKIFMTTVTAAIFGAIAMAAPAAAQTQYYGSYLNQPRNYGPPSYVPPPPPAYTRPNVYVAPGYGNRAYYDYRHFGDPTTQDSLMTCSYC